MGGGAEGHSTGVRNLHVVTRSETVLEKSVASTCPQDAQPCSTQVHEYTQTLVPRGNRLFAQIQSMASLLTRTQPCETGDAGT